MHKYEKLLVHKLRAAQMIVYECIDIQKANTVNPVFELVYREALALKHAIQQFKAIAKDENDETL